MAAAPAEIAGSSVSVAVEHDGQRSNRLSAAVYATSPSLLSADGSGTGPLNARNDDGTLNTAVNPAARGSLVTVYATGLGRTDPPQEPGRIATTDQVHPLAEVTLYIGGSQAQTVYVGSMPGFVNGAFYIVLRVPADVEPGVQPVYLPFRAGESIIHNYTLAVE